MLRNFLILTIILIPYLTGAQTEVEQQERVDQLFAQWNSTDSPGCALAVVQDGKIRYARGYGMADLERGVPNAAHTVFYIGSVSKQFVAMCMLMLEEQGKLDLDADVRTYLPEFPDYGHPITIRNLIHHTSGIRDNLTLWELTGRSVLDEIPEDEIYELIRRQEQLNFTPGTRYLYSNSCYFMMSLIVERVSGQSLREYAQEHLFEPLGMRHTIFGDDNRRIIKHRAFGYRQGSKGDFENMLMRFDLVGSGGLYTTVEDLYLWDQNFYQNRLGKRGQALIDDMLTNGRFNDGSEVNYAFALSHGEYRGLPTVGHSGALGGYRSYYVRFPEQRFSVIVLSNLANFLPGQLAEQVADVYLADEFVDREQMNDEAAAASFPETISLSTKQLQAAVGHYWNSAEQYSRHIYLENDTLRYGRENSHSALLPISERSFLMAEMEVPVIVSFDETFRTMTVNIDGEKAAEATAYEPFTPTEKTLMPYQGSYYSAELDTYYRIAVAEGQLKLHIRGADPIVLSPVKRELFQTDMGFQLRFQFDKKEQATGFRLDAGRVQDLKFERVD